MSKSRSESFHQFPELLPELKQSIGELLPNKTDLFRLAIASRQMWSLLSREIKTRFLAANKIIDITGTPSNTFFTTQEGELYVCGRNYHGELGVSRFGAISFPTRITLLQDHQLTKVDVADVIAKAQRTIVLKRDGKVFACGSNKDHQLFTGSRNKYRYFLQIRNLPPIKKMKMRGGSLYLLAESGLLYTCGDNTRGQLGFGHRHDCYTPTFVLGDIIDIEESGEGILCLKADGTVFAFGDNTAGQLGLPERTNYEEPALIETLKDIDKIWSINKGAIFREKSGKTYACGYNAHGRLGVGSDELFILTPTLVRGQENIEEVSCVGDSLFYITKDRRVYASGDNAGGRLGLGDQRDRKVPELIPGLEGVLNVHPLDNAISFFLLQAPMHVCGSDVDRLPGMKSTQSPVLRPITLPWAIGTIKKAMHSQDFYTLLSDAGAVHGWGRNVTHALGLPNVFYDVPTKINLPHVKAFLATCSTADLIYLAHIGANDYHDECFNMALERMQNELHWQQMVTVLPLLRLRRCRDNAVLQTIYPGYQELIASVAGIGERAANEVYKAYAQLLVLSREMQNAKVDVYTLKRFAEFIDQLAEPEEEREEKRRRRDEDKYARDNDFITFFKPHSLLRHKEFLRRLDDIPERYLRIAAGVLADYIMPDVNEVGATRKRKAEDEPEDKQSTAKYPRK